MVVTLDGSSLTIDSVIRVARNREKVRILKGSLKRMERYRSIIERSIDEGKVIYGINTGFGSLSDRLISYDELKQLQLNLIRSHATGVGEPFSEEIVRAAMLIRLNGFLKGNSGVRPVIATMLMGMLNSNVTPYVPSYGSLGASGDLTPSAHMALTMIGEGKAYHNGKLMYSSEALQNAELKPVELDIKEGLSLINGTCFSTALACFALHYGKILLECANSCVAITSEAIGACSQSFDERLISMRNIDGQRYVSSIIRKMLSGSKRIRSEPVPQDPYSIRCTPQIHGSTKEAIDFAEHLVSAELNSVTDNPVISDDGEIIHGGNFHAQPIAMASDILAVSISYLGSLSLARIHYMLTNSPKERRFLAVKPGLESGLMISEYTASSLAAENAKELYPLSTYPANVSAGIEDHASYGVNSGLKALRVTKNISRILAIELICASNMLINNEDKLSAFSKEMIGFVRGVSQPLESDRVISDEIEELSSRIIEGSFPHLTGRLYTSSPSLKTLST